MIAKTNDAHTVRWLDRQVWQYPLDAWVLQEMIAELRPDVIVETGTYRAGSAYYFACLCDLINHGQVVSIDTAPEATLLHPRVTYLKGSSVDPEIVGYVAERLHEAGAETVLVVLDSDHRAGHVLRELEEYGELVPVGSYIHVQDGCIDQLPEFRRQRPGPLVAVEEFLKTHGGFERDTAVEGRYVMTAHPCGWLRRVR